MQLLTVDGTTGGREFQTPEEKGLSQLLLFFFFVARQRQERCSTCSKTLAKIKSKIATRTPCCSCEGDATLHILALSNQTSRPICTLDFI